MLIVINHETQHYCKSDSWVIRCNIKTKVPKVREAAYNSLVRPQLEYASAVWDPHMKVRISQIEQVQRRAGFWTASRAAASIRVLRYSPI